MTSFQDESYMTAFQGKCYNLKEGAEEIKIVLITTTLSMGAEKLITEEKWWDLLIIIIKKLTNEYHLSFIYDVRDYIYWFANNYDEERFIEDCGLTYLK